jgi:serine/threonine protein kinase
MLHELDLGGLSDESLRETNQSYFVNESELYVDPILDVLKQEYTEWKLIEETPDCVIYSAVSKTGYLCVKIVKWSVGTLPIEVKILEYIRRHEKNIHLQQIKRYLYNDNAYVIISNLESDTGWEDKFLIDDIRCIISQLLEAVGFLHHIGVVHRDIKPSNYTYDIGTKHLCLIDFDLSTYMGDLMAYMGTDGFVAPEIIKRKPYNHMVDMYSVGCVLGCLLFSTPEGTIEPKHVKKWRHDISHKSELNELDVLFLNLTSNKPSSRLSATHALHFLKLNR